MRMLKLPDERIKILVQGLAKGRIEEYIQNDPYYSVRIEKLVETKQPGSTLETEAVMRTVKEQIEKIVSLGKVLIPDVMVVIRTSARSLPRIFWRRHPDIRSDFVL